MFHFILYNNLIISAGLILLFQRSHIDIGFRAKEEGNNQVKWQNSIQISHKRSIWIDRKRIRFVENAAEYLRKGEVIGLGIIHCPSTKSPMKCFVTCNGKLLGKIKN